MNKSKKEILQECIIKNAPIKYVTDKLDENTNLTEDLGYTSLDFIILIIELEKIFNFKFDSEKLVSGVFTYKFFIDEICKGED